MGPTSRGVKGGKGREKGRKGDGNSPSRKVQFLLFFLSPLTFSKKVWEAVVQDAVTRDKMTAWCCKSGRGPNTLGPHDLQSWRGRVPCEFHGVVAPMNDGV